MFFSYNTLHTSSRSFVLILQISIFYCLFFIFIIFLLMVFTSFFFPLKLRQCLKLIFCVILDLLPPLSCSLLFLQQVKILFFLINVITSLFIVPSNLYIALHLLIHTFFISIISSFFILPCI